jgi:hypothetical protein
MADPASPAGEDQEDRCDQVEDRSPKSWPGGAVSFPVSLIAEADRLERLRSFLAHPSGSARVMRIRSGWDEQASAPQAGFQARSAGRGATMDWHEQEVMNELDARRRNEWIVGANDSFGANEARDDYVCECSDSACATLVNLSRDEYESVRRFGTHFVIAINHENPEIDQVIGENGRFAIVEKWYGPQRRLADETDPRS